MLCCHNLVKKKIRKIQNCLILIRVYSHSELIIYQLNSKFLMFNTQTAGWIEKRRNFHLAQWRVYEMEQLVGHSLRQEV